MLTKPNPVQVHCIAIYNKSHHRLVDSWKGNETCPLFPIPHSLTHARHDFYSNNVVPICSTKYMCVNVSVKSLAHAFA